MIQKLSSYDYNLPKELIAKYPANPKDSSKLLIFNRATNSITHTIFRDIMEFLPKNIGVVFNNTKVIKARIFGEKESGGKLELLVDKPLHENKFLVFIKGRVKVGTNILFPNGLIATVQELVEDLRIVKFFHNGEEVDFVKLTLILDKIGHIPLPPYINRADEVEDEKLYQPIFAKHFGAVAAPTASLHFSEQLYNQFLKNFNVKYLTLHVGAGTFKSVEVENILEHKIHSEYFSIDYETKELIDLQTPILSVGTTVARTVEYYFRTKKTEGEADIFLHPLNSPQRVNHLLTNFHLPKSTLLMLVASFIGLEKTMELYNIAISNRYRFFSYGDAMLII